MRPENAPETTHIGKQDENRVLYRVHFTDTECFTITSTGAILASDVPDCMLLRMSPLARPAVLKT